MVAADLEQGREAYSTRRWVDAHDSLSRADRASPLGADDLELLARSAYMLGRDDEYVRGLERAHHDLLDHGEFPRAVRCAFWIGHNLMFRGETGPATGWFARAERLLQRDGSDCVEHGYLLIPAVLRCSAGGDYEGAQALTRWCAGQPDMVAHNGLCLVHRAELMTLGGDWQDALAEAERVRERFTEGILNQRALGHAAYARGEVFRLLGKLDAAEDAYREASRSGREPMPGLALLRLATGSRDAAAAAIRRALDETNLPLRRAALLPAYVEIATRRT